MRHLSDDELFTALNVITAALSTLVLTTLSVAPHLPW